MRFLRLLLISFVVLFIVVSFLFALFPANISVSRVININADPEKAWSAIEDLSKWKNWNHFTTDSLFPLAEISVPATGKNAYIRSTRFEMKITDIAHDTLFTLWSKKDARPFTGKFILSRQDPGGVIVQWSMDFHFRWYPWEKLGAMFYDKQLGPVMESSLVDLKNYIEKIP